MSACSSCKAVVPSGAFRCPKCGAEVLGLELALDSRPPPAHRAPAVSAPPVRAPAASSSAAVSRAPVGAAGAAALDLDLGNAAGVALPPKLAQGAAQNTGLRIGPDGKFVLPPPKTLKDGRTTAGLDEDGLDPYEVRAYADYGDPPQAIWLTPLYAQRVIKRRKELREELVTREEEVKAADDRIEDAVVAFGERLRPVAAENPIYARTLAPIEEVERLVMSRDSALAGEFETYKATTSALDEKLRAFEARLHALGQESAALEGELTRLEEARARAQAKARRAEIEIRSAQEAAAAQSAAERASLDVHVKERQIERATQEAEMQRLAPLIETTEAKLEAPRAERVKLEREISGLRKQRGDAEEALKRKTSAREAGSQDARKRLRAAFAEFGRIAITDAKTFGGEYDASRRDIEDLVRQKMAKERTVLMVQKAIASADDEVVKKGILFAVAASVVFLLLVVGIPLYRAMRPVAPPPLYPTEE